MQTLDLSFLNNGVLYDRTEEQQKLIAAFDRRISGQSSGEFILLSGKSGTGKTALAQTLREHVARQGGFFVSGKFDQLQQSEPYSALVSAFTQLLTITMNHQNQTHIREVKKSIHRSVQRDLHLLTDMIPALKQLAGSCDVSSSTRGVNATQRLKLATRNLVRAMCSQENPLVLFMDDLQWADSSSLDLLTVLASDKACRGLVLIGACRYEEVALEDDLADFIRNLEDSKKIIITTILLHNLPIWAVNDLVSEKLQISQKRAKPLTKAIYKKTLGNILFVVKCLEALFDNYILVRDENGQWQWDPRDLLAWSNGVKNVTELVKYKIKQLSSESQIVLTTAACCGTQIDRSLLEEILPEIDVSSALDQATRRGLIVNQESGFFKFVHDRVQQAAYDLIPETKRDEFHLDLGRKMQKHLHKKDQDTHLFLISEQMSRGSSLLQHQDEKDKLASLCLHAGEKASQSSDFKRACDYISQGINMLSRRKWRDQYYLCLDLYNAAAEAKYCTTEYADLDRYISELLANATSLRDKIRAYSTMMLALSARHKLQELVDVGISVLDKLGEKIPSKSSSPRVFAEIVKTEWMLRNKTDDDILNLPDICEPDKVDAMSILNILAYSSWRARRDMFPFVACRMVQLTIQYGKCAASSYGFQLFSILMNFTGKPAVCHRYSEVGLRILNQYNIQEWTPRVYALYYGCNLCFARPMHTLVQPLNHAHEVGLKTGDYETSANAAGVVFSTMFFLGKHLKEVENVGSSRLQLMEEYKQDQCWRTYAPVLQTIQNLRGKSKDPLVLTGTFMDQEEVMSAAAANKDLTVTVLISFYRLVLAYIFNEYELTLQMTGLISSTSVTLVLQYHHFYNGLVQAALAQKHKWNRRKHFIRAAKKAARNLKKLSRFCPSNAQNNLSLLEAEICFSKGDFDSALPLYQRSIELAKQEGFLQERALANERAGIAFDKSGESQRSIVFLKEAMKLYGDWGAHAKVYQMKEKFPLLSHETMSAPLPWNLGLEGKSNSYTSSSS